MAQPLAVDGRDEVRRAAVRPGGQGLLDAQDERLGLDAHPPADVGLVAGELRDRQCDATSTRSASGQRASTCWPAGQLGGCRLEVDAADVEQGAGGAVVIDQCNALARVAPSARGKVVVVLTRSAARGAGGRRRRHCSPTGTS
jgi:hypothetical protein